MDTVDWGVHGGIIGSGVTWGVAGGAVRFQVTEIGVPDRCLDGIQKDLPSTFKDMGTPLTVALGTPSDGQLLFTQLLLKFIYIVL